jgi:hypothetical protein
MSDELWTAKEYHLKFRNELGFERGKHYLDYLHGLFPDKVLHHLLGSASAKKKYTDYLIVPLTLEEHAKAHKNLPLSFMLLLPRAIKLLIGYAQYLEENLYFKKLLEKPILISGEPFRVEKTDSKQFV